MTKIEFCNLLFKYVNDGFTVLDIEMEKATYTFDFESDYILLSEEYFELESGRVFDDRIYYRDVKGISC